ncbi:MAG: hypothetical protein ABEH81_16065 [Halopenitus sp.]
MDVFADLLARDRRSEAPALKTADGRTRSYHELLTNAYKAGNALRHVGVREGVELGIAPVPALQPVLAFLGAGLLGAVTRFDPAESVGAGARGLLVPAESEAEYDPGPATKVAVFGGDPARAGTTNWEETMWSENPSFPPTAFGPETPVLAAGDERWSHGEVLGAAAEIADVYGFAGGTEVVIRTSLATPGAVVAGLIAPLYAGGTAVLTDAVDSSAAVDSEAVAETEPLGTVAVGTRAVPESAAIDPDDVPL